jgi:hypothetical protein
LEHYREMSQGHNSNASTPVGSGSRTQQPSRTRGTAGSSSNPTLQNRYRKPQKALDFSAHTDVTASEATWSVEEEMQNYLRSPIPHQKSTDMVGYCMVYSHLRNLGRGRFFYHFTKSQQVSCHRLSSDRIDLRVGALESHSKSAVNAIPVFLMPSKNAVSAEKSRLSESHL